MHGYQNANHEKTSIFQKKLNLFYPIHIKPPYYFIFPHNSPKYSNDLTKMLKMKYNKIIMKKIDNPQGLTIQQIYNINHRRDDTWSFSQYQIPRQYLDPGKQIQQRVFSTQKKGQKTNKYVTRRGFYLDYQLKVASQIPGSNKHGSNSPWEVKKYLQMSKNKKIDPSLIKQTYLQQIQIQQKNRKKPGICTYSLQKSLKQKDKQVQLMRKNKYLVGEKHFFHHDTTYLGGTNPGSGQYNPHDTILKLHQNKTDCKYWIKKHKDQQQRDDKRSSKIPAPGTYTPLSASLQTFDKIMARQQKNTKSKSRERSTGFGTDARFQYTRTDRKVFHQKRPDPLTYNTAYQWTTAAKFASRSKPWNQMLSKGNMTTNLYL